MKLKMAKAIEIWDVEKLKPYENNARTHSEKQIGEIARSIETFGFNNPVLVDSKEGIIAGHGRLMAAKRLGIKEVPVIVLDHLTEKQKKAFIIADNKITANAGWDNDILAIEIENLKLEDFDLDVLGFSPEEMKDLFPEVKMEDIDGGYVTPEEQYIVSIECGHEKEMQQIYDEMTARGFKCRLIS